MSVDGFSWDDYVFDHRNELVMKFLTDTQDGPDAFVNWLTDEKRDKEPGSKTLIAELIDRFFHDADNEDRRFEDWLECEVEKQKEAYNDAYGDERGGDGEDD